MQEPSTDAGGHAPPALIVPAIAASFLCRKPQGLLTDQEAEKVMLLKRGNPIFATIRQLPSPRSSSHPRM
jgi:hypothetical protein